MEEVFEREEIFLFWEISENVLSVEHSQVCANQKESKKTWFKLRANVWGAELFYVWHSIEFGSKTRSS